jgi:hypothetical protein
MQKGIKEALPIWWQSLNKKDSFLVLSDDIDSLLSCIFLNQKFDIPIGAFYDFNFLYHNPTITKGKKAIFVDIDTAKYNCFSNHVTIVGNKNAINLNQGIYINNYHHKYAGSTLLTILSLFDFDFTSLNDEQIKLLLCIDVSFKGFYNSNFKETWLKWMKVLEFPGAADVVQNTDFSYFSKLIGKYKLNEKIKMDNNNYLNTRIDLESIESDFGFKMNLPDIKFTDTKAKFNNLKTQCFADIREANRSGILFSNAMTFKGAACVSFFCE